MTLYEQIHQLESFLSLLHVYENQPPIVLQDNDNDFDQQRDKDTQSEEKNFIFEGNLQNSFLFTPRFLEAISSITSDFFRTPLEKGERQKFIGACPKNMLMQYDPPKLNDVPEF
ncbi:hypothetical protein BB560_006441 [Smittium megazygosporum]|uniref:Uncharacterized protein n=1 Tax=Smittium megazygosporum TaxID=133381 RepID=A0A2T9Y607_9FUNG|nr:hypothetical protein BB560_006441 [Smittium megazygosporum]